MLKFGTRAIVFVGGIMPGEMIWALGDIGLGLITWVNMTCLILLAPLVYRGVPGLRAQRRAGLDPVFDSRTLGTGGADFWVRPAVTHRRRGSRFCP